MKNFADCHVHFETNNFEEIEGTLDYLSDTLGVTDIGFLAVSYFDISQNLAALYWKKKFTKARLAAFAGLYNLGLYSDIPYEKQVSELLDMGIDGMKLLDMKPDRRKLYKKGINDVSYDKMFSLLEDRGTPVLIHANDPDKFWDKSRMHPGEIKMGWYYGDGGYLTYEEIYEEVFKMLDKHPRLNVVFAHFFFLGGNIEEATRVFEKYPNVKFDLTPGWEMFVGFSENIEKWHDFFEKYNDRILFGTDIEGEDDNRGIRRKLFMVDDALRNSYDEYELEFWQKGVMVKGLNLSKETREKICYTNYTNFVKEIKPINEAAFEKAVDKMLCDIKDMPEMAESVQVLEKIKKSF